MNKVFLLIVSCLFLLAEAKAANNVEQFIAKALKNENDICAIIKKGIASGLSTKDVVKSAIEMKHEVCYVIECAIDGGGSVEEIIKGALEAGASIDIICECKAIAEILEPTPIAVSVPGESKGGGVLSPFSF